MGALDPVVQAPDGAIEHWEPAYKLFLQCDEDTGWASLGSGSRPLGCQTAQDAPATAADVLNSTSDFGTGNVGRWRHRSPSIDAARCLQPIRRSARRAAQGHQTPQGRWLYPSHRPACSHVSNSQVGTTLQTLLVWSNTPSKPSRRNIHKVNGEHCTDSLLMSLNCGREYPMKTQPWNTCTSSSTKIGPRHQAKLRIAHQCQRKGGLKGWHSHVGVLRCLGHNTRLSPK